MKFKIEYELQNFFQQGMMILVKSIKVYNTLIYQFGGG